MAIAIGVVLLVALIIIYKLTRVVMSGCMKLVVLAVLVSACTAAYFYFRTHVVLP